MAVIDAQGQVMGRLASNIAQRLMHREEIIIVNAEKAIVTGTKEDLIERYGGRRKLGGTRGKGPHYPRMPDQLMKRTVRGMLPFKKSSGKTAYKHLRVYIGVPKEFESAEIETYEQREISKRSPFMELGSLSKYLGAKF